MLYVLLQKHSSGTVLLCSHWPLSTIWPMLFQSTGIFQYFIKNLLVIEDASGYIKSPGHTLKGKNPP